MSSTALTAPAPRGQARPMPRPHQPQYRLTRRGRLVVVVVALLALLAVGVVFAQGSVATQEKRQTETIVVAPGDTLWDIASARADDGDVTGMMRHVRDLNDLDSVVLVAGQQLIVPAD